MAKHQTETNGPRAALARAIGARNAVAENVEALRKTRSRLENAIADSRGRIDAAKVAAEEDRETRLQHVLAGDDLRVLARRDDGVAVIEREIEDLRGALAIAKTKIAAEEVALDLAGRRLDSAVADVIRAEEIEPVLKETERLKAEFDAKRSVLRFVRFSLPPGDPLERRVDALLPGTMPGERAVSEHASEPWRRWRLALMADANAELPR